MAPNSNVSPENGYFHCGFNDLLIYATRALTLILTTEKKIYGNLYVVLWDMTSCSLVGAYLRFGETYHATSWKIMTL